MSNYLRGPVRAVGFTDDTASRGLHGGQGHNEWDMVSHASSQGGVNLLNRACRLGQGQPPRGGTGQLGKIPSTVHMDWDKGNPQEGWTGQLGTPSMMATRLNGTINNNRGREGGTYPGQSIGMMI